VSIVRYSLILAPLAVILVSGCGPQIAEVRGKVTFEGKPVTAGIITFAPKVPDTQFVAGRPASAMPDDKGEFRLTTNSKGDGALVGTHNVTYQAPGPPRDDSPVSAERFKTFGNLRLKSGFEFEVKPGVNNVTLELERAQ
jgi:hypothetical protein